MKQIVKRVISIISVFAAFVLLFSFPALAATSNTQDTVISEYDYIMLLRALPSEELDFLSSDSDKILLMRSNAPELELLSRKKKTDVELSQVYGYSENEIALLRAYHGESLESNPSLAALTGTLTISQVLATYVTSARVDMKVVWEWDHCPLIVAKDVLAICWNPTFGNSNGNMRLNITKSSHTVTYKVGSSGSYTETSKFTQVSLNSAAKVEFQMQGSRDAWASKGLAVLYFEAVSGSAALTEMDMIFAYGHTVLSVSPSVSFPPSFGISFGANTSDAGRRSGYVSVERRVWVNN